MGKVLVVVFEDDLCDSDKGRMCLHEVDSGFDPNVLRAKRGEDIASFFETRGVTLREYMDAFPGYVTFDHPFTQAEIEARGWTGFRLLDIPSDPVSLKKLEDMMGMPVVVLGR